MALIPVAVLAGTSAHASNVVAWNTAAGNGGDVILALTDENSDASYVVDLEQGALQYTNGTVGSYTITVTPGTGTGQDSALNTFLNNATSAGDPIDFSVVGGSWNPASMTSTNKLISTTSQTDPGTFSSPVLNGDLNKWETEGTIMNQLNILAASASHSWAATAGANGNFGAGNSEEDWAGFTGSLFFTNLEMGTPGAGSALSATQNLYEFAGSSSNQNSNATVTLLGSLTASLSTADVLTLSYTQDINPVPLPAAFWLFGSGLLGLVGIGRRRASSLAA